MGPEWVTVGVLVLVGLTAGITFLVAALVWRAGYKKGWRMSRTAPPICPTCGYNLSGLTVCRCPECGTTYTLERLWRTPALTRPKDTEQRDSGRGQTQHHGTT